MNERISIKAHKPSIPAAAIATAAFAYESWFFLAAGKSGAGLAGGLIWAAFVTSLFAAIAFGGKPEPWRRIFFFTMAVTFVPSFVAHLVEARGHMAVTGAEVASGQVPFCHIALTTSILPAALFGTLDFPARLIGSRASFYPMLAYWLLSLVTLGRGWCSWVCFYGGVEDGLSAIRKKPAIDLGGMGPRFRTWNRAMLLFVALAGLGTLIPVYCDWLCPFKLVTEYSEPSDLRSYLALIVFVGLYLALVVVLPIASKRRTQCSLLCPFGAMQSFLDRLSPFTVAVDTAACVDCGACDRVCPTLALNKDARARGRPESSCVKCGTCFDACRFGALRYAGRFGPPRSVKGIARASEAPLGPQAGLPSARSAGARRLWGKAVGFLGSLSSPALLFPFTAMSFGMIISTAFSAETMTRIVRLVAAGGAALANTL